MLKLHLSILIGDFKHMALHCHHYLTRQRLFWNGSHAISLVVSTILSLILFDSFWYCGNCYNRGLSSSLRHSCPKKVLVEIEKFTLNGWGYYFPRALLTTFWVDPAPSHVEIYLQTKLYNQGSMKPRNNKQESDSFSLVIPIFY